MNSHSHSPADLPPRILSVSLNPAWQKTLLFDDLVVGAVNRATWLGETGGGKGINFARAGGRLGAELCVAQFVGGHTGQLLLREQAELGVADITVQCSSPTRTCTTVVATNTGLATELIEPSGTISEAEVEQLREKLLPRLADFAGIALCGTYPPRVPESLYAEIAAGAGDGALVLLDGVKGVEAAMKTGVDLLKINGGELARLAGTPDVRAAAKTCFERYKVRYIGVTDGPCSAYLFSPRNTWCFQLPKLENIQSAIGAGDCASAVLLLNCVHCQRAEGVLSPDGVVTAFTEALACASASCLTAAPAIFSAERAARIHSDIHVEKCHPG